MRWGAAVVVPLAALLGNFAIPDGILPGPFFVAAVMIVTQLGGYREAVATFVVSGALLTYYFVPPYRELAIREDMFPSLLQFIVPSVLGAWFIEQRKDIERLLGRETALSKRLQGEQTLAGLGRAVVDFVAPELGAPIAALYVIEPDGVARRCGAYAFDASEVPEKLAAGQGVIGQVVRTGHTVVLGVPDDYITVRSGLGRGKPRKVVVVPARDGERTHAVLELGFFRDPDRGALRFLERLAEPLAIAVRTAEYRTQVADLLEETQRQAEALKAHDEELRAANEELQERGQQMQESQRRLEEQHQELEQNNELLQEQANQLERQHGELAQAHDAVRLKSERADRANLAKSEFLANMSHELRTPLNSSLILAKLLTENRDGNLTSDQIRYAESIYAAGNDLLAMIDEILDHAKIEAGHIALRIEEITLARLCAELERTFAPVAADRRVRFDLVVAPGTPATLPTDEQRLVQVLRNLLSNAFKFTERGTVSLAIECDAEHWSFAVRDTGIGIPEEKLAAIFEPFQQGDGTTSRRFGGTGLGLSISRDLAALLGGALQVTSQVGMGSTFTLKLPVTAPAPVVMRRAELVRAAPALEQIAPSSIPVPAVDDRSILVIEDDARFATIVTELANELRFEATVVATADDAIREALARPPKGIVLDMKLPDHSGLSVLDRLKRDPRTRHIPVHVISIADHTRAALEMGAIGYMLKPVAREQITSALRKLEVQFTRTLRRLLVVEDDATQREAIRELLHADNVEIVAVATAAEALAQLRAGAFDCVVLDLALPDSNGYALLETMAKDEAYSFPSVVVYTGRSLTPDDEQRLRRYSSSIIVKGARSPERLLDEVTLFLHQVEAKLPPERQRMLKKARHREAIFEGKRILIAEDDVRNVFALTSALEPKGMVLTIARNGREALAALERDPEIDLVLMDIMMPEMDGLEAMQLIRARPIWAKLPIIALTAKAMKDDQERCLQAGANDYMPKPVDVEMLLSLVRVWLAR